MNKLAKFEVENVFFKVTKVQAHSARSLRAPLKYDISSEWEKNRLKRKTKIILLLHVLIKLQMV